MGGGSVREDRAVRGRFASEGAGPLRCRPIELRGSRRRDRVTWSASRHWPGSSRAASPWSGPCRRSRAGAAGPWPAGSRRSRRSRPGRTRSGPRRGGGSMVGAGARFRPFIDDGPAIGPGREVWSEDHPPTGARVGGLAIREKTGVGMFGDASNRGDGAVAGRIAARFRSGGISGQAPRTGPSPSMLGAITNRPASSVKLISIGFRPGPRETASLTGRTGSRG